MKCPIDGETLLITQRSGVEIDYCPKCRGVWLDRGELDKLIEREDDEDRDARGYESRDRDAQRPVDNRAYDNTNYNNRPHETRGYEQRGGESNPLDMIRDALGNKSGGYKRDDDDYRYGHKKKKKGGLLGEIFDF